jgi:hypothetical protein
MPDRPTIRDDAALLDAVLSKIVSPHMGLEGRVRRASVAEVALRVLWDHIDTLRAERDAARAQLAAWEIALHELAYWPDLPGVPYAVTIERNGTVQTLAIEGHKVQGVLEAIHSHFQECAPFGEEAAEAFHTIDTVRAEREALAAKVKQVLQCQRYDLKSSQAPCYLAATNDGEWLEAEEVFAVLGITEDA